MKYIKMAFEALRIYFAWVYLRPISFILFVFSRIRKRKNKS